MIPNYLLIRIFNHYLLLLKRKLARSSRYNEYYHGFVRTLMLVSRDFKEIVKRLDYPILRLPDDRALVKYLIGLGAQANVRISDQYVHTEVLARSPFVRIRAIELYKPYEETEGLDLGHLQQIKCASSASFPSILKLVSQQDNKETLRMVRLAPVASGLDFQETCDALRSFKGPLRIFVEGSSFRVQKVNPFVGFSNVGKMSLVDAFPETLMYDFFRNIPTGLLKLNISHSNIKASKQFMDNIFEILAEQNDALSLVELSLGSSVPAHMGKIAAFLNVNKTVTEILLHSTVKDPSVQIYNSTLVRFIVYTDQTDYSVFKSPSSLAVFQFNSTFLEKELNSIKSAHFQNLAEIEVNLFKPESISFVNQLIELGPPNLKRVFLRNENPNIDYYNYDGDEEEAEMPEMDMFISNLAKNTTITYLSVCNVFTEDTLSRFLQLKHPSIKEFYTEDFFDYDIPTLERHILDSTLSTITMCGQHGPKTISLNPATISKIKNNQASFEDLYLDDQFLGRW